MKKLYSFVLSLLLALYPIAVQSDEIAQAPSGDPMSEDAIKFLQSEDIYQGSLSWQGNKVSTKFNYDMKKKNK